MKRMYCLLLALIMALCLAACGEKEPPAAPEAANTPLPMRTEEAEPMPEPAPESTPEPTAEPTPESGGKSDWSALYAEYRKRFDADIEAFNTGTDTAMLAMKLTKGEVDLAFTATFFEPDAEDSVKNLFETFGLRDVTYTEQGDTATAEGTDSNGAPVNITLQYDGGNTAAVTYTLNGELSMALSLCVMDEYAAKLYKSYDADNQQTVCGIVKPNGDVWLGVEKKVLEGTLYQNEAAAADVAFATGLPESYTYIGGVLTKN